MQDRAAHTNGEVRSSLARPAATAHLEEDASGAACLASDSDRDNDLNFMFDPCEIEQGLVSEHFIEYP